MHSTPLTKGTSGRVHKLQSKSQTNALEPSSSYSFLFLCHSKVLSPPLPSSTPVARAPLAKMFCWHAKVLAQVASLPFSLPNAWHLPQLSCDRGRAREGGWWELVVRLGKSQREASFLTLELQFQGRVLHTYVCVCACVCGKWRFK